MPTMSIKVDHVARIEGHGNVRVQVENGVLKNVQMNVVEPARLFESMVRGRRFPEIPYIASRICGICSASHVVTDILAIEKVFDVHVSDRTRALRDLLVYGSYLQNHASHLFVFAAPDFLGHKSIFPLADGNAALLNKALGLKALGNELCTKVGGRSIHPICAVVGGFTHEIDAKEYLELADKMDAMRPFALEAVELFKSFSVADIQTQGELLAMYSPDKYAVCDSSTLRLVRAGADYDCAQITQVVEEYEVDHSAALFARIRDAKVPYFASALSRINASWDSLCREAKLAAAKVGLRPPEYNPFMNNVAQAVEIVDALNKCADLCRRLAADDFEGSSSPVDFTPKAGAAVGFTEAPRGALFHCLEFDDKGRVVKASIMTPTAQNLANLEADMRLLAEELLRQGASEELIRMEIEKLVRAYDPCLSCSVH